MADPLGVRAPTPMVANDQSQPFAHQPVMVDEIVALIAEVPSGEMLDATVGGGGHAEAVLTALSLIHI